MSSNYAEVRIRGKDIKVPATVVDGRTIVVTGKWLSVAKFKDEELVEGELVNDPVQLISTLKARALQADILSFPQAINEHDPKFSYPFEWDNVAAADTRDFNKWWEELPQESRKNARRAAKRGVTVELTTLDGDFVRGIKSIYDESPIRQGMRFWHYGKSLERVRLENETYLERSDFLGAYHEGKLIGFMKWVYVGKVARIMQILSMSSHYDKRPMNAMLAKAVEVCHQKGAHYLVYSKFTFGNKSVSQLADFKRRNGFVKMDFPMYHVPLTIKGRIAIKLGVHRGLLGMLPPWAISLLWQVRAQVNELTTRLKSRRNSRGRADEGQVKPSTVSEP